jgi:hypothetical protein
MMMMQLRAKVAGTLLDMPLEPSQTTMPGMFF